MHELTDAEYQTLWEAFHSLGHHPDILKGSRKLDREQFARYLEQRLFIPSMIALESKIQDLTRAAGDAEVRAQLAERRAVEALLPWKEQAEKPYPHNGMKQSLRGLIARVSEILEKSDEDNEVAPRYGSGYAYSLRALQRHLCAVWNRRGEPSIVAEFGALYCLDIDGPIEEPEDDSEGDNDE